MTLPKYRERYREKANAYNKRYYQENREAMLARAKEYREANASMKPKVRKKKTPEELSARRRELYQLNKEKRRAQAKVWREANKDRVLAKEAEYREANREKLREGYRKYAEENGDLKRANGKRYREANRERINSVRRAENATPEARLVARMRTSFHRHLKGAKRGSTLKIFGYTQQELRDHLESQFLDGMGWHNMGEWHIDHIIPLAALPADSVDHPNVKLAWALENLQPLWATDNLRKKDKIPDLPSAAFLCGSLMLSTRFRERQNDYVR